MGEDAVGDVFEHDRSGEQCGRAIDDRLRPGPFEAQLRIGLVDLLRPFEADELLRPAGGGAPAP
jgi:hypothetical protein